MASQNFDVVIVGGGLAGLVLAARLTEDPEIKVVVLEAGEDMSADPRVNVPMMWQALLATPANWGFMAVPQPGLGDPNFPLFAGRVLGGGTALNGLAFTAPSRADVDSWEALGNPGWGWESFSKSLRKSYSLVTTAEIGSDDGPLRLTVPEEDDDDEWPRVWRETMSGLGFPVGGDPFDGAPNGALTIPDTVHPVQKVRSYAGSAYLEPARSRPNLAVWTGVQVERILFDKSGAGGGEPVARGVSFTRRGGEGDEEAVETVTAAREVILSAGTVNSPRLLELSGVGDAARLRLLGIDVVVDNPYVGENFQNHPMCVLTFEVEDGVKALDGIVRQDPAALAAASEAYQTEKAGPLAKSGMNAVGHLSLAGIERAVGRRGDEFDGTLKQLEEIIDSGDASSTATASPTTAAFAKAHRDFVRSVLASQTEASACYFTFPGWGQHGKQPPAGEQGYFTIAVMLSHPLSRGSVHLSAVGANMGEISIDPQFFSHPLDAEVLARHVHFVESRLAGVTTPREGDQKKELPLPSRLKKKLSSSKGDLLKARDLVKNTAVGTHHYTGTCSMMPREIGGVVDSALRVYGCRGLRVCDASVIPITMRTNPQATVYGVAEHAAGIIKSTLRSE